MSGIFGFTCRSTDPEIFQETLGGLEYWNRIYGREKTQIEHLDHGALGCHIEHFSESFPYGGPVLQFRGCPAVVDALLYNRDELSVALSLPQDHQLSDENLLLKWIDEKGFHALAEVNGDFSGAIYDENKQEWILFRDHLGVRPLYFYNDSNLFAFSTDIRGIVAIPGIDNQFNGMLLFESVLRLNRLTVRGTDFEHIQCIMPGSVCRFRLLENKIRMKEQLYWRIRSRKIRFRTDEEYQQEMRRLVTDSVQRRCDAMPGLLGAELSGGLDSGIIDIILSRYGRDAVFYSWSIDPKRFALRDGEDERKVVLDICEQENITCKFLDREERFNFDYMLKQVMPPFVNTVNLSYGSKWMHSQGARCVFTGHGGDEGVSHRGSRYEVLYNGEVFAYFKMFWQDAEGLKLRLPRAIRSGILEAWARWRKYTERPTREELYPSLLSKSFCDAMVKKYRFRPIPFAFAPYQYVRQGGTRGRLDNAAYQGAYNGVRYLFPYVDYRVMDFAVSIPRRLHVGRNVNRVLFRNTFEDIMPRSLREMRYKDMASIRTVDYSAGANRSFHHRMDYLLEHLDPDLWSDVFDFDAIRELSQRQIRNVDEESSLRLISSRIDRCLMIQNVQKQAKRWREFDAENKIL